MGKFKTKKHFSTETLKIQMNSKLITIAALFAVTNATSCNGDEDCIKEWIASFMPIKTEAEAEDAANNDKIDEENDEKDEKAAEDDTANETTENEHTKKVDE